MRPEARLKCGFYPAPPEAIAHIAQFLRSPRDERFSILDPCAGQGEAINQLALRLDCDMRDVYAVRVGQRAGRLAAQPARRARQPCAGPADFLGRRAPRQSFSFDLVQPAV